MDAITVAEMVSRILATFHEAELDLFRDLGIDMSTDTLSLVTPSFLDFGFVLILVL